MTTLGVDLQSADAAIYNRLASDLAGSTARGVLGSSSAMTAITGLPVAVFDVDLLKRVTAASIPLMWAGYQRGAAAGQGRIDMTRIPYDWWLWGRDKYSLEGLCGLLDVLYQNVTLANGRVVRDLITNPVYNDATTLYSARVRLSFSIFV